MDDNVNYLPLVQGGRWAISRWVGNRSLDLIQDTCLDNPSDATTVLRIVGLEPTKKHLDHFFPIGKGNGRRPTIEIMERFARLDNTIQVKKESGV